MKEKLRVDIQRILTGLNEFSKIGALDSGGVSRQALTETDFLGREKVINWMKDLGLEIKIDRIGNITGIRKGSNSGSPVLIGSHIDTLCSEGIYESSLGIIAGLEIIACLNEANIVTDFPIGITLFTNNTGDRFLPMTMGSMFHQSLINLDEILGIVSSDGTTLNENLNEAGYSKYKTENFTPEAYFELHVEQGPFLEQKGITIGAVEGVQGLSCLEINIKGVSNNAGTTPMYMRHDAGYVAVAIGAFVRQLAFEIGGDQIGTVGYIELSPNSPNVIPGKATLRVDLRNTDPEMLKQAEIELRSFISQFAKDEGVSVKIKSLYHYDPISFDQEIVTLIEDEAKRLDLSVSRIISGSRHDACSFVSSCPTGMVFVPSVNGISHNTKEYTNPEDLEDGANLLLNLVLKKSGQLNTKSDF